MFEKINIKRKNPIYSKRLPNWEFFEETYRGGKDYLQKYITKQRSVETDDQLKIRRENGYFLSYSNQMIDTMVSFMFSNGIQGREKYPEELLEIIDNIDFEGHSVDEFFKYATKKSFTYGVVGVLVDSRNITGEMNKNEDYFTKQDIKDLNIRPYIKLLLPHTIIDWSKDPITGEYNWIMAKQEINDDYDFSLDRVIKDVFIVWTKENTYFFDKEGKAISYVENKLGFIPVFLIGDNEARDKMNSLSLIENISFIDKNLVNNLSLLDQIIRDQTFSQKVVETDDADELDEDDVNKIDTVKTQTVKKDHRVYFIAPDASQAGLILNKISFDIKQILRIAGLQQSNDLNRESGIAKSFNSAEFNAKLSSRSKVIQSVEEQVMKTLFLFMGGSADSDEFKNIKPIYPKKFDVFELQQVLLSTLDILGTVKDLSPVAVSELVKRVVFKSIDIDDPVLKAIISKEIEENSKNPNNLLNIKDKNYQGLKTTSAGNLNNIKNSVNVDKTDGNFNQ